MCTTQQVAQHVTQQVSWTTPNVSLSAACWACGMLETSQGVHPRSKQSAVTFRKLVIAGDELFADVIYPQPESFVALHDKAYLAVDYELADVFFFHVHKLFEWGPIHALLFWFFLFALENGDCAVNAICLAFPVPGVKLLAW